MSEVAQQLASFKIRDLKSHTRIYHGFTDRYKLRSLEKVSQDVSHKIKIPTGIIPLDNAMHGGIDRKDILGFLSPSGVGKSKALKFLGSYASRLGFRVVHIQVEGSAREAEDAYDAALANKPLHQIEYTLLSQEELNQINYSIDQISQTGGEIFLKAYEQFDSADLREVRDYCQEIVDKFGAIDLIILDYLDEIEPGDGKKYKGRGVIQITGRANYTSISKDLGVDFVTYPNLLSNYKYGVISAGWYWNKRNLNSLADDDNLLTITKKVNGGLNGFNDRSFWLKKCKLAIK